MQFTGSVQRESAITNRSVAKAADEFRTGNQGWFDGTPQSVDRRLAQCRRVLTAARGAVARSPFDFGPSQIIAELEEDHRALVGLRHDLLNGYPDRETPIVRQASNPRALTADERRWVTLEAPKFVRANLDAARDENEISTRAIYHTRTACSGFSHPREVSAAFHTAVLATARRLPPPPAPPRTASRNVLDMPPEAMWL